MKSYNAKIKQKNNNEWNIIYPYTKAKNVSLSNGINLEEVNASINREIVGINSTKASKEELNNTKEELNENITSINGEIVLINSTKASKEELNSAKEKINENITSIDREIVGIKNTKANKEDLENANTNISYVENSLNNFITYKNLFETEFIGGCVEENGNQKTIESETYEYAMTRDFIRIYNSKEVQIEFTLDTNILMNIHITCIHLYDKNKNYIGNISKKKIKSDSNHKVYIMSINKEDVEYIIPIFKCINSESTEYEYSQSSFVNYLNSMNFLLMRPFVKKEKTEGLTELEDTINDLTTNEIIFSINNDNIESGAVSIRTGRAYSDINFIRVKDYIKLNGEKIIVLQSPKYSNETIKNINVIGYTSDDASTFVEKIKTTENSDNEYIYYNIPISKEIKYIRLSIKINSNKIKESEDTSDEIIKENIQNVIKEISQMEIELKSFKIKKEKVEDFIELEEKSESLNNSIEELKYITKRNTNIFDGIFEEGAISTSSGNKYQMQNYSIRSKNFIEIDNEITNLTLQRSIDNNIVSNVYIVAYDSEKKFIKKIEIENIYTKNNKRCYNIILSNDIQIKYIKFGIIFIEPIFKTIINDNGEEEKTTEINTEGIEKCKEYIELINFQIEYGLDATDYIPYKLYVKKDNVENFNKLEEKVNELFTSVSNGKNLLETAITDKGGTVSKSGNIATFEELKNGIGNIKTGINIFSQIDKPTSNNGIWIKNNKIYENIDFFDSSEDTTFENEKMTDLSFYFYTTNRTLTIKKEIYILTKYTDSNDNIKSLIYKYNTENNVYEVVSSISDSTSCYFYESCAISVGNYIYLFNLKSIQNPSDCSSYKYNIETNTYTGINNSISISNGSFAIAINNNEIYIFSGTKIYLYNISTNSYETLENCPYDCRYGAGILINNDIYIFGGVSNYAAYKYDIINKQFTKLKDIPSRFSRNNIIKIDNYIYLFGCSSDYKELDGELNAYEENKKSYRYDINSDSYERVSDVPYDILVKRVELVGNNIYILGSNTTTNKKYNIKLTKKELKPNSILFMNTQIIPRYNVKLYNNIDYEKMNNFSFYKMITTNENAEIETVGKYIYNDSKWIKI